MEWNGARWWKFDFHTHTPASDDYGKGARQEHLRKRTPREWLLDFMAAGIDCVAVTDHNTGDWVDRLKQALEDLGREEHEGYRELHLFPGMEISVHGGIHVLAILDPLKDTADINTLLGAVGYRGTSGKSDEVTTKSLVEVVNEIALASGIAIPAHADGDKGLFKQLKGTTLEQALGCNQIFAMELVDPSVPRPQQYSNKALHWTEVLGSDSHHPSSESVKRYPGSHYTWVKMGSPNIEGLRLALLDGHLSTRRSDQEIGNPNKHASQILESLEVSHARYMGRRVEFEVKFSPWLNTIIGGRGTGKSTSVEFLRKALRREDELPEELAPEFEKYNDVYSSRQDTGLLTPETSLKATYRKDGARFCIQWDHGGNLDPIIEQEANGKWHPSEGDIPQRFPIRIYSQKQIFELAKDNLALLKIIDDAPKVNRRSWDDRWNAEEARFLSLRAKAREMEAELAEESHLRGELSDVERKLDIIEKSGHTNILKTFNKRRRQSQSIEEWEESWVDNGNWLREIADDVVPNSLDETNFDSDSPEDNELRELAAKTHSRLDEIRKAVVGLAQEADGIASEWRKAKDTSTWQQAVNDAEKAYEDMQEMLTEQDVGDPSAYETLVQDKQSIEQRLKRQQDQRSQILDLKKQANESLQNLLDIRREITASRRRFLEDVLDKNQYVKIHIIPYGARETIEGEFRQLIQREDGRFERDIGRPSEEGLLKDLCNDGDDYEVIEKNIMGVKSTIAKIFEQDDTDFVRDQRFVHHIKSLRPEVIDRLDIWFPEDSLEVQYSTTGDGDNFRSIQEGSPGQRTAALLAFLLSYGDEPLVLDQPEDDLDNQLIYDLIVTQLRNVKLHRQIIVVTHNANIVVNGDAEQVIALGGRGGETQIDCEGSLQEENVREIICNVMEGGRKAFEARYRRIALEGHHV